MDIGNRIKFLRSRSKLSQNSLAEKAGVSQTHLRRVELGQADITVGHLQLICDALDITLNDFFNGNDDSEELSAALSGFTPKQKKLLIDFLNSFSN